MAKNWNERWGAETNFKHGSSKSGWRNKDAVKSPVYISDSTRAVKLTEDLLNQIKTRLLLGLKVIRVPRLSMYYTAQLKTLEYVDTIYINGSVLRAKAIKPYKGVWEFIVINR